jgi:hypothetical protein
MKTNKIYSIICLCLLAAGCNSQKGLDSLRGNFLSPPDEARPGVNWCFMDGNLSKEGITGDLEGMKEAGIGNAMFMEINVGVPRGKVDFWSEEWQSLFVHAVNEARRLGIELTTLTGPGWTGSGGPWVKPEQSMRNLMASDTLVKGPAKFDAVPALPPPYKPPHNYWPLTPELRKQWESYYKDVCVLAFPAPAGDGKIADVGEKALYFRAPYSSMPGVKHWLPSAAEYDDTPNAAIDRSKVIDLTDRIDADGRLQWDVPEGKWTIMRFVMRNNGVVSRPAPEPGLGFECDKLDTTHLNAHFDNYLGTLFRKTGKTGEVEKRGGWTMLQIDSWEMNTQNWSDNFRSEFTRRRGYDPLKYLPVYTGKIIDNIEVSERFLWDVRQTGMELLVENHALHLRTLGRRYGMKLTIQPYDMNPASDFDLASAADVPNCEFWANGHGYNTVFGCTESASVAHIYGRPVVVAEAFTSHTEEGRTLYPETVKNQGDWAFAAGITRLVYTTHTHKPFLSERVRPGMTMGPYGAHWDRSQTWWKLSSAYHRYVTRCQYLLRQGRTVADILYLNREGAPHVFTPPVSAFSFDPTPYDNSRWNYRHLPLMPDRRGYNFDVCSPAALIELAEVNNGRIEFPGGASYRVLVLPESQTMTPKLLQKIETLIKNGAVVIGNPPAKSPSLTNYPACDDELRKCAERIWGKPDALTEIGTEKETKYGKGMILCGGVYSKYAEGEIYPDYQAVAGLLNKLGEKEDFSSQSGKVRYTHRTLKAEAGQGTEKELSPNSEIYFVSNRTDRTLKDVCTFHAVGVPELWNPVDGSMQRMEKYSANNGLISVPMEFASHQSYFVVFDNRNGAKAEKTYRIAEQRELKRIDEPWEVRFDTLLGGPAQARFDRLSDWSQNDDRRIRYYSGSAFYTTTFDLGDYDKNAALMLDLGTVKNIARVKLNGKDLGIVWTAPWQVDISKTAKKKGNKLEIEVANLWPNRLIGDEHLPYDGVENGKFPDWLLNGTPRTSGRVTFTTVRYYSKDSPLLESGLMGPVTISVCP